MKMNKTGSDFALLTAILLMVSVLLFPIRSWAQNDGSISGVVYQSDGTTPFTEDHIYIEIVPGNNDPCSSPDAGSALMKISDGTYTISDLSAGTYYLRTSFPNLNYTNEWWAETGSVTDCTNAQLITLEAGESVSGKNFQLDTGATLSGTIYQSNGAVFTEADIPIDVVSGDPCGDWDTVEWGYTNASDGTYKIIGLPPGTYYLRTSISDINYVNEWWGQSESVADCSSAESFIVASGETVIGKDFQLASGATVSGIVYQSDGVAPFTGTRIYIDAVSGVPCGDWDPVRFAYTDASDGTYTIAGLPQGIYYLRTSILGPDYVDEWWAGADSVTDCADAQPLTVTPGEAVSEKDFQLASEGSISGVVYQDDGTSPLAEEGVFVQVISEDPCGDLNVVKSAPVNSADGTYTIAALPPGIYYVRAAASEISYLDEWWAESGSVLNCDEALSIKVGAGEDLSEKNFQLAPESTISGTIYHQDGITSFTEENVSIQVISGDPCGEQNTVTSVAADASDGTYSIDGLFPGIYYLQTLISGTRYADRWWAESGSIRDCANAGAVTLESGESASSKNFQLTPILKGDVNEDGKVNMTDAILAMQTPAEEIYLGADVNGDGEIGLAEVIYILKILSPISIR